MDPPDDTLGLIPSQLLSPLAPIDRLPEDILVAIFGIYVEMHWRDLEQMPVSKESGIAGLYNWIRVSHVNKLWRDVALRRPSLWSRIVLPWKRVQSFSEFLSRSQNCPLHVQVYGHLTSHRGEALDLVKLHAHRLATLEFRVSSYYHSSSRWQSFVTEALVHAASLTRCNLRVPSLSPPKPELRLKSAPGFQRLSHLKMRGIPFSIVREFFWPGLISLSITCADEDVSFPVLLSVLSTMSSLTELSVYPPKYSDLETATQENSETEVKDVRLPHLSMLKLSSDHVGSGFFLDHLVLPSTTKYEMDFGVNPSGLARALERKLQGNKIIGVRPPFRYGQLSLPTGNSVKVEVWKAWATEIPLEEDSLRGDAPLLCLRMCELPGGIRDHTLISALFLNWDLGLSELKTLKIARACRFTTLDFYYSFFTLTPHLEDISLTGSCCGLRHASLGMTPIVVLAEAETILLPHLHTLSVGFGIREARLEEIKRFVGSFNSMLKLRMRSRSKVQKLMISGLPELLHMPTFEPLEEWVDSIVPAAITNPDAFSWHRDDYYDLFELSNLSELEEKW